MELQSAVHATFALERSFPVAPARVFQAFSDPEQRRRWFAPGKASTLEHFEQAFRVGGQDKLVYRFGTDSALPGMVMGSQGIYLEIQPDRRIVAANSMDMVGRVFSASLQTFELEAEGTGTRLRFTFQGTFLEGADGPAMREQGWVALFNELETMLKG